MSKITHKLILAIAALAIGTTAPVALQAREKADPDWWVEDRESLPKYSDYKLFTLTPDESEAYGNNADAACFTKAKGDPVKRIACNKKKHDRIDKQLNTTYRALMAALPAHRQQTLRQDKGTGWPRVMRRARTSPDININQPLLREFWT
jgi:hypothetical protein